MGSAPIAPDEGSKSAFGAKEPFVGKISGSWVNHDCEACTNDKLVEYLMENENLSKEEAEEQAKSDFDHFMQIEVLGPAKYEGKTFHVLSLDVPESGNFESKWMVEMGFLHQIHGNLRTEFGVGEGAETLEEELEQIAEFLVGRAYEFKDISWTEDEYHPFAEYNSDASVTFKEIGENSSNEMRPLTVPTAEVDPSEHGEPKDTGETQEVDLSE